MREDTTNIKLDPKRRQEAGARAALLREEAGEKRHQAALLEAQAARLERSWQLRPYERP